MAPFVLKFKGNKSFSPLGQINDADTLTKTWKVCTKVAAHLEQGQRLENLSWRLWFLQIALVQSDNAKQKREFKKFSKGMSDKLDKDKGRSIHELQAPNFKRTDSTDKVRLRVEEMAHHRENGTVPPSASRYASDSANYMKGMQYTFAVDPRVKPIATTNTNTTNTGEGGRGMMGKMRVRPMHPPPIPPRALMNKDGDTTMQNASLNNNSSATTSSNSSSTVTVTNNALKNEHAMDVSDDHAEQQDEGMQEDSQDQVQATITRLAEEQENDAFVDNEEGGTGHHTPTPQHLLPSHHPSALPYPPPPSTGPHAQALSNALSNSSGQFVPPVTTQRQQQNIIRFPTIFSSDFGPTSLLCALPTATSGPAFSFESSNDGYQSFSAMGQGAQSSITTQGIYGPNGPPGMGYNGSQGGRDPFSSGDMNAMGGYNSGLNGIGVGMQNAGTPFNFGVPRPTFEFPIDEILKSEMGEAELSGLGGNANQSAMGQWDGNMGMDFLGNPTNTNAGNVVGNGNGNFGGMGGNPWGVPPAEISSPTSANGPTSPMSAAGNTSPTKRSFQGLSATAPQRGMGNSATVAYGVITTTGHKANSNSPTSVHSATSGPNKDNSMFEGGQQPTSPQSTVSSTDRNGNTIPGAYASTGRERSGSVTGGVGSVVPGNVGNTAPGGVKSECANCGATHTPLWRRGLNDELNCNACGLYCKLHKRARPKNLRTSHGDRAGTAWGTKAGEAELAGEPVQCHNCATMATPLWRKDDDGNTLCNACGLYLKLHGTRRPLSMKSDVIRKRSRHETEKRASVSSIITVMTPTNGPQNSRRNSPTPPPSAGSNSSGPEPFVSPAAGTNSVDGMGFSFGPDFSFTNDSDYMSGLGMGLGNDLAAFSSFGSYGLYSEPTSMNANGMGNGNGMTSPTSPAEIQHIVETTVMVGVENGGGHVAPHAKRRRMTLESSVSGSSLAHTTGGANSAHSSPTGLGQQGQGQGNSPPYIALDSNGNTMSSSSNNNNNNNSGGSSGGHADQNGSASPTRSTFGSSSPTQSYYSMTGVTLDFYGHPIHPPMAPLHPPSLIHPQWLDSAPQQFTPTQSSMGQSQSQSQSQPISRPASHNRSRSYSSHSSHSRSGSQHITMPLYLYDGGASSRAYEGANAATPTASGTSNGHPTEDELFGSGFDLFGDHEDNRVHYGPATGL